MAQKGNDIIGMHIFADSATTNNKQPTSTNIPIQPYSRQNTDGNFLLYSSDTG